MTAQSYVVWGLLGALVLFAILIWRAAGRRTASTQAAKRALRLREKIAWDRVQEQAAKRADPNN